MKKTFILALIICSGCLLFGCESGPLYNNRYFPLNQENLWVYKVTVNDQYSYLASIEILGLSESDKKDGDVWEVEFKGFENDLVNNNRCTIRNKGGHCFLKGQTEAGSEYPICHEIPDIINSFFFAGVWEFDDFWLNDVEVPVGDYSNALLYFYSDAIDWSSGSFEIHIDEYFVSNLGLVLFDYTLQIHSDGIPDHEIPEENYNEHIKVELVDYYVNQIE